MPEVIRVSEIDIDQDLKLQDSEWRFERIAWSVMTLAVILALAGLLGPGALSREIVGEQGSGFWAVHNRFTRYESPEQLTLHIRLAAGKPLRLWIDQAFVNDMQLSRIDPRPEEEQSAEGRITYLFSAAPGNFETVINLHFQPNSFGLKRSQIGIEGGPALSFWSLVYP